MPAYLYKRRAEIAWAVAVAVLTPLLVALSTLDPETIADWRVWAVGIAAAMVRAGAAAVIAAIGPGGFASD